MKSRLQGVHPGLHANLTAFTDEMVALYGEALEALLLYGSGAGRNFIPGKSNINLLLVLAELRFSDLQKYQGRAAYWKRKGIDPPLFTTVRFLESSADIFPIEWLEIITHHVVLHGANPFRFAINHHDLRRQCEKEIREILIRLRQAFLEVGSTPEKIEQLALVSLNAVFPVLRSLMVLQNRNSPADREALLAEFFKVGKISPAPFLRIWSLKKGGTISDRDFLPWFEEYLNQLEALSRLIDDLDQN